MWVVRRDVAAGGARFPVAPQERAFLTRDRVHPCAAVKRNAGQKAYGMRRKELALAAAPPFHRGSKPVVIDDITIAGGRV